MIEGIPKVYYFTDRKKIAQEIQLPPNTDLAPFFIIGPNNMGTGYKQADYDKNMLWFNVHMNKEELRKMILGFNNAHTYVVSTQRDYEYFDGNGFFWRLIRNTSVLSFSLAVLIFIYVRLYNTSYQYMKEAMQASFFFACVAVISAIFLTLLSCKRIPKFVTYQERLEKRMTKVIDYFNNKLKKKGLKIIPGKKFIWLEIWKVKFMETSNRPIISLTGGSPIVDYSTEKLGDIIEERKAELSETYKKRFNMKYLRKLMYLEDFYKESISLRDREKKALEEKKKKEEKMAPRMSLVQEQSASNECSNPNFQSSSQQINKGNSGEKSLQNLSKRNSRFSEDLMVNNELNGISEPAKQRKSAEGEWLLGEDANKNSSNNDNNHEEADHEEENNKSHKKSAPPKKKSITFKEPIELSKDDPEKKQLVKKPQEKKDQVEKDSTEQKPAFKNKPSSAIKPSLKPKDRKENVFEEEKESSPKQQYQGGQNKKPEIIIEEEPGEWPQIKRKTERPPPRTRSPKKESAEGKTALTSPLKEKNLEKDATKGKSKESDEEWPDSKNVVKKERPPPRIRKPKPEAEEPNPDKDSNTHNAKKPQSRVKTAKVDDEIKEVDHYEKPPQPKVRTYFGKVDQQATKSQEDSEKPKQIRRFLGKVNK